MEQWWDGAPPVKASDNWWDGAPSEEETMKAAGVRQRVDEARKRLDPSSRTEEGLMWLPRYATPFASSFISAAESGNLQRAEKRALTGEATQQDYDNLARDELRREHEAQAGFWQQAAQAGASVPKIAGEVAILGPGAGAAEAAPAAAAAPWLSRATLAGAGKLAARQAATAPLIPSLYLPAAAERARERGGEWIDPTNIGPPLAHGMLVNVVLGAVGNAGQGLKTPAQRFLAGTGAGMAGMEGANDFAAGLDQFLPEAVRTETGYGPLAKIIKGERGEGLKQAGIDLMVMAAFSAMHELRRDPSTAKGLAQQHVLDWVEKTKEMARQGVPAEEAAKQLAPPAPEAPGAPGAAEPPPPAPAPTEPPQARPEPPGAVPEPKFSVEDMRQALMFLGLPAKKWSPQQVAQEFRARGLEGAEERPEAAQTQRFEPPPEPPPESPPPEPPPPPPEPPPVAAPAAEPPVQRFEPTPRQETLERARAAEDELTTRAATGEPILPEELAAAQQQREAAERAMAGEPPAQVPAPPPGETPTQVEPSSPEPPPPPPPPEAPRPAAPAGETPAQVPVTRAAAAGDLAPLRERFEAGGPVDVSEVLGAARLSDRQRLVIEHRYGINGRELLTQAEIARRLGVTREAVEKLERKARERLGLPESVQETIEREQAAEAVGGEQAAEIRPRGELTPEQRKAVRKSKRKRDAYEDQEAALDDLAEQWLKEAESGRGSPEAIAAEAARIHEETLRRNRPAEAEAPGGAVPERGAGQAAPAEPAPTEAPKPGGMTTEEARAGRAAMEELFPPTAEERAALDRAETGQLAPGDEKLLSAWMARSMPLLERAGAALAQQQVANAGQTPLQRLNALYEDFQNPSRTKADVEAAVAQITEGMDAKAVMALAREFGTKAVSKKQALKKIAERVYERQDRAAAAQAFSGETPAQVQTDSAAQLLAPENRGGEPWAIEVVRAVEEGRLDKEAALRALDEISTSSSELAAQILRYGRQAVLSGQIPPGETPAQVPTIDPVRRVTKAREALKKAGFSETDVRRLTEATEKGDAATLAEVGKGKQVAQEYIDAYNQMLQAEGKGFGAPVTAQERRVLPGGGEPGAAERLTPPRTTALAKDVTAAERERLASGGLNPVWEAIQNAARRADPRVWAEAQALLRADPEASAKLVAELTQSPRPTNDVENALLLHRKVALSNELERATLAAVEAGKPHVRQGMTAAQYGEVMARAEAAEKALDEFHRAVRKTGTEAGRGFRWFAVLLAEDYSLAGMLRRAQAAKRAPLTPEERATITQQHREISEADDRLAEAQRGQQTAAPEGQKGDLANLRIASRLAREKNAETLDGLRRSGWSPGRRTLDYLSETFSLSRALKTAYDLSAVLRQGGFLSFAHPIKSVMAFPEMMKAAFSEHAYQRARDALEQRPNANLYSQSGLYLADRPNALTPREESFVGRWGRKIPGVRQSERAYNTFLNRVRADVFDASIATMTKGGKPTPLEAKVVANFINVATGRGNLYALERAAPVLSQLLFSPRYVASRLELLAAQPLWRGNARTRKLIAMEYARAAAGLGVFYMLALAANDDAEVESDPRSSDFGKLRIGRTRIDPLTGLQQPVVMGTRVISGQTKTGKGKIADLRGPRRPYAGDTTTDVMTRFARSKLAPVPGTGWDIAAGENLVGEPTTPWSVGESLARPMASEDVEDALLELGLPRGAVVSLLSILGMGSAAHKERVRRR